MPGSSVSEPRRNQPLRLRAEDFDDLAVISACLQDALVSVRDLAYDRDARGFMLVANRFRWEKPPAGDGAFERTLCGVSFSEVDRVTYRGFQRGEEDRILSLLAICRGDGAAGETIDLEFSGGAAVRLSVAAVRCLARDLGEPWPTQWHPDHKLDDAP